MAFHLDIPDAEREYLDKLPLSPQAREAVKQFVEQTIANISDTFRLDPENRPDPSKPCFRITHLVWDLWGDRRVHTIDFYLKDADARYGVLLLAFTDHR